MAAGLLDTSVVIDLDVDEVVERLPDESAISAVTLAELAAGPHLTSEPAERARRQARLQEVEALYDALPVDAAVARSYGQVVAPIAAIGRTHRSPDLLIAATAHAARVPLYTRNPDDLVGLEGLITIVAI